LEGEFSLEDGAIVNHHSLLVDDLSIVRQSGEGGVDWTYSELGSIGVTHLLLQVFTIFRSSLG
jgi:hypothetical protein